MDYELCFFVGDIVKLNETSRFRMSEYKRKNETPTNRQKYGVIVGMHDQKRSNSYVGDNGKPYSVLYSVIWFDKSAYQGTQLDETELVKVEPTELNAFFFPETYRRIEIGGV